MAAEVGKGVGGTKGFWKVNRRVHLGEPTTNSSFVFRERCTIEGTAPVQISQAVNQGSKIRSD